MIISQTLVGSPSGRDTPRKENPVLPKALHLPGRVGGALGDQQGRAARHVHGAQGGDERGDIESGDQQPVDRSNEGAHHQRDDHHDEHRRVGINIKHRQVHALEHHAGNDAGQADD
nr:hypothetical protein [Actinomyces ruminis]